MSQDPRVNASSQNGLSGYASGQLWRALKTSAMAADEVTRRRAAEEAARWRAVLEGMSRGQLQVGSRAPITGTPGLAVAVSTRVGPGVTA